MHLQFAELPVFDQDRAMTFYTEHLGCTVRADTPMGDDGWRWSLAGRLCLTRLITSPSTGVLR